MARHEKIVMATSEKITVVPMIKGGDIEDLIFGISQAPKQHSIAVSPYDMLRICAAKGVGSVSELAGKLVLLDDKHKKMAIGFAIICEPFRRSVVSSLQPMLIRDVSFRADRILLTMEVESSDDIEDFIYSGYKIPTQLEVLLRVHLDQLVEALNLKNFSELVGQTVLFDNVASKLTFFCIVDYEDK